MAATRAAMEAAAREGVLVREWIRRSLYAASQGYFATQDCVYTGPAPTRFRELTGKGEYVRLQAKLYRARAEAFLTPVELFRPWYSRAIARYVLAEHERATPDEPLDIVEVGGGNGTNALHVLDYLREAAPSVYDKARYTLVEISPAMAERQRLRTQPHGDKVQVVTKDFSEWDQPARPGPCFVLALEVLDNLPHDKIVRNGADVDADTPWWTFDKRQQAAEWSETIVAARETPAGGVELVEELRPLADPLATRAAELFLGPKAVAANAAVEVAAQEAERGQPASLGDRVERWARGSLARARATLEDPGPGEPRSVFVPSRAVQFMDVLRDKFPAHHLVAADFDALPPPDVSWLERWRTRGVAGALHGCRNAPLVASKDARGFTQDHMTYLVDWGTSDIFFQTDFAALEGAYAEVTGREGRTLRSRDFLREFSEHSYTRTRSGYNPMLDDYFNTQFIVSRA